jgi:hypothetical protein
VNRPDRPNGCYYNQSGLFLNQAAGGARESSARPVCKFPCPSAAFTTDGLCEIVSESGLSCVQSPTYSSNNYGDSRTCTIYFTRIGVISAEDSIAGFDTEPVYDKLTMMKGGFGTFTGTAYSGRRRYAAAIFTGIEVTTNDYLTWSSDASMSRGRWRVCMSAAGTTKAPTVPPTEAPTLSPTKAPTLSPTTAPTVNNAACIYAKPDLGTWIAKTDTSYCSPQNDDYGASSLAQCKFNCLTRAGCLAIGYYHSTTRCRYCMTGYSTQAGSGGTGNMHVRVVPTAAPTLSPTKAPTNPTSAPTSAPTSSGVTYSPLESTKNQNNCTSGYEAIATSAECQKAAIALSKPFALVGSWETEPKNCFFHGINGELYYNTHAVGSAYPSSSPICKKARGKRLEADHCTTAIIGSGSHSRVHIF